MTNVKQARDVQVEPCLQRKKRLDGPTTTLSSDFNNLNNANIEYILLGKNDKFQDNIKYKCRPMRPDDPQVDDKGNDLPTKSLQDNSPKHSESDQYILLGNNTKFANNIVYKLKPFPNGTTVINEEDKENALFDDNANRIKAQEGITKLEEYILLGKNDKFSDNVVYRPKVRREFIPNDGTANENSPIKATDYFPVQTKPLEPAPVIDTSKFREPPKKCKNPVETNDSEIVIKKKKISSASQDESEQDVRLPLDHLLSPKQGREEKSQTVFKKDKTDADKDVLAGKSVKFQSPPPAPRSPNPSNVNEETDKKLLGLLHKSKIYIPPHSCVIQSEYQKNFTWKKPLPNFPTAAENKKTFQSVSIFKANTSSPDPILKLSEYQRNFQAWTPSPTKPASPITSAGKPVVDSEENVQREAKQKVEKLSPLCIAAPNIEMYSSNQRTNTDRDRESKEDGADISVTTPEMSADDDEDNDKQGNSVKNTEHFESVNNPTEKTAPVNHLENLYSEYTANFKAPSKCHVKNAWDVSTPADENIQSDSSVQGDWYSEVLDLRRKASEYRHRAENTHFCSGRMGQLLLDETQPCEPAVSREDVRNLKSAGIIYSKHNLQNPTTVQNSQLSSDSATESQMILEDVSNDADVSVHNKPEKDDDANCPHTMSENDTISAAAPKESSPETESQPVGRIPTPELQEQHMIRHHLDRTTPTKGNLLITSPMTQKQIEAYNATEHANSVGSHSFSDAGMKPKHCVQTCSLPSKINSVRTFGKPSKDARILGDQRKISSKPFHKTSSVQESQRMNTSPNVTLRSGNKRPKKIQVISEKRPAGIKVNCPMPETLTSTDKDKTDLNHDFLSQSLDSNNSLATDVLERTRKRLNFW